MFEDVSLLSDTKQLNGVSQFALQCTNPPTSVNSVRIDVGGEEIKNDITFGGQEKTNNCQCCPGGHSTFQCCPVGDPYYSWWSIWAMWYICLPKK